MGRRPAALGLCLEAALLAGAMACGSARQSAEEERNRCTECHGLPPSSGAHSNHATPSQLYQKSFDCIHCHFKPHDINDPGHILDAQGRPISPQNQLVRFDQPGSLGNAGPADDRTRVGPATYEPATKTCSAVYCHGGTFDFDTRASNRAPSWAADQPKPAPCGSCHGLPPADHVVANGSTTVIPVDQTQCVMCHGAAITATGIPNPDTHINGTVNLKQLAQLPLDTAPCNSCHGKADAISSGPSDPVNAPPADLLGNTTGAKVGAHQAHLTAGKLAGAFACGECHVVPAKPSDPAHIDNGLTATITFGTLPACNADTPTLPPTCSIAKGSTGIQGDPTTPSYDPATGKCSSVYCHGAGSKVSGNNPSSDRTPTWSGSITCGTSCHQLPPTSLAHADTILNCSQKTGSTLCCADCHSASIDASGNIIVVNGSSAHVNGRASFGTP